MHYLKLKSSQIVLFSFLVFALLLVAFPVVDLSLSRLFFDGKSFVGERSWSKYLQTGLGYFLVLSVVGVLAIYAVNRLLRRRILGLDGRRVLFVILVLAIGAGLIVNVMLKDNFGRARPRDLVEFGGTKQFTPAFVPSSQCNTNCSFASGDAAGAFFAIALAMALGRRRAALVAALVLGALVSISRIAAGAHFLSDTVTSFFIMVIVADILFFYLISNRNPREGS